MLLQGLFPQYDLNYIKRMIDGKFGEDLISMLSPAITKIAGYSYNYNPKFEKQIVQSPNQTSTVPC